MTEMSVQVFVKGSNGTLSVWRKIDRVQIEVCEWGNPKHTKRACVEFPLSDERIRPILDAIEQAFREAY